jgi:hypothetical protein
MRNFGTHPPPQIPSTQHRRIPTQHDQSLTPNPNSIDTASPDPHPPPSPTTPQSPIALPLLTDFQSVAFNSAQVVSHSAQVGLPPAPLFLPPSCKITNPFLSLIYHPLIIPPFRRFFLQIPKTEQLDSVLHKVIRAVPFFL